MTANWYDHAWIMLPLERGCVPLVWCGGRPHMAESADLTAALRSQMTPLDAANAIEAIREVVERFERT